MPSQANDIWPFIPALTGRGVSWFHLNRMLGGWKAWTPFARRYLAGSGRHAERIPCSDCKELCPRRVKRYDDGTLEAVCPEHPTDYMPLEAKDSELWRLDANPFHESVCRALGFAWQPPSGETLPCMWRIGECNSIGFSCPVYAAYPAAREKFDACVEHLAASLEGQFVLLGATRDWLREETSRIFQAKNASYHILPDIVTIDGSANILPASAWNGFSNRLFPSVAGAPALCKEERNGEDHWFVFGKHVGKVYERHGDIRARILNIIYEHSHFLPVWIPHVKFITAISEKKAWSHDDYFGTSLQSGKMDKQLHQLRRRLGNELKIVFDQGKGIGVSKSRPV